MLVILFSDICNGFMLFPQINKHLLTTLGKSQKYLEYSEFRRLVSGGGVSFRTEY